MVAYEYSWGTNEYLRGDPIRYALEGPHWLHHVNRNNVDETYSGIAEICRNHLIILQKFI